jgi:hypothetical protein
MPTKPSKKSLATVKKKRLVAIAVFFMIRTKIRKRYSKFVTPSKMPDLLKLL